MNIDKKNKKIKIYKKLIFYIIKRKILYIFL